MSSQDETSPKPEAQLVSVSAAPDLASADDAAQLGVFLPIRHLQSFFADKLE